MIKISTCLIAAALFLGSAQIGEAAGESWTCALMKGMHCLPDEGCSEVTMQEMNLPRFVRIDLPSKLISSLDKEIARQTKIASVERVERITVLHGTELRGWSVALAEESGDVTLSASGEREGFIVFGSCLAQ